MLSTKEKEEEKGEGREEVGKGVINLILVLLGKGVLIKCYIRGWFCFVCVLDVQGGDVYVWWVGSVRVLEIGEWACLWEFVETS